MKKQVLLIFSLVIFSSIYAQKYSSINFLGGKSNSSFNYHNSLGEKDSAITAVSKTNFGVNLVFDRNRNMLRTELLLRQSGAQANYDNVNLKWNMTYLDLGFDYLLNLTKKKDTIGVFTVAPGFGFTAGYMLTGEQFMNEDRYSLIESKVFNEIDYTVKGILLLRVNLAKSFFLSAEYRIVSSLNQIEKIDSGESTKNIYQALMFGIGFKLR